jgi:regulator of protease activity HflC (stomatin/prohibitin superfamily)
MEVRTIIQLTVWLVIGVLALILLVKSFFIIHTMQAGVIERLGRFNRIATEGPNFKWPLFEKKVYVEDLSMQLVDVTVSSKTKDDATIHIPVRIQYFVLKDRVREAYYKLDNPERQIKSHVENVILSYIPNLDLDDAYKQEDQIALKIKTNLEAVMAEFGYAIQNALVTQIIPDDAVTKAMNDINAARREQVAQRARAEALKLTKIAEAEADSRAKILQGEGIAGQRRAIIDGLRESVKDFESGTGVEVTEVLRLVMMTQYFDALRDIGSNSNTILLPNSPGAVGAFLDEFRTIMMSAELATKAKAA